MGLLRIVGASVCIIAAYGNPEIHITRWVSANALSRLILAMRSRNDVKRGELCKPVGIEVK